MLGDQRVELVHADAVLARAGAAHRDRAHADALRDLVGFRALRGARRIEQHEHVEVAVADVPDDGRDDAFAVELLARLEQAIGEPRDRHARVGRERLLAGRQRTALRNTRCAAPSTASSAPRPASPTGTRCRRARR